MDSDGIKKRMHVLFSGRVQGVGFRYTVCRMAVSYAVTGYVRNLPDGDVEMVAEGNADDLQVFLHAIRNSLLARYIISDKVSWEKALGKYDRFGISH